jgi:hypothetical protein
MECIEPLGLSIAQAADALAGLFSRHDTASLR